MKGIRHLLVPAVLIFVLAAAVTGVTYAWVNFTAPFVELPGDEGGYFRMAELNGEVSSDSFEVAAGGLESGSSYSHSVTIRNTSDSARAHLRAYVTWAWQEADGTQVALPRGLIKEVELRDADSGWTWTEKEGDSWVRERVPGSEADADEDTADVLDVGKSAEVELVLHTGDLSAYETDGLSLKVRFVVKFEGEFTYEN